MGTKRPVRTISTTPDALRKAVSAPEPPSPETKQPLEKPAGYAVRTTTLTVEKPVADLARKVALAIGAKEGKLPALSEVVLRALGLLVEQLEADGVALPPGGEVRPGPRGGGAL